MLSEKVYCQKCKGRTNHKIIAKHSEFARPYDDFHWHEYYYIVQCLGCEEKAFVKQYGDEDGWDYVDGEREWIDTFTVYPEEPIADESDSWYENYKIPVKRMTNTPENIYSLYKQIVESFNNQHFVLCTSGLRTIIEGICSHLDIKKGYLYDSDGEKLADEDGVERKKDSLGGRIFGLFEKGYILFPQALILQKVKIIGNSAVHDIIVPEFEVIKDIIHIIERVLYDIFELRNHSLLVDT